MASGEKQQKEPAAAKPPARNLARYSTGLLEIIVYSRENAGDLRAK
jgi:hypothetical protein